MKKLITIVCAALFAVVAATALFAETANESVWELSYKKAETEDERLNILIEALKQDGPEANAVLLTALADLNARVFSSGTPTDQSTRNKIALLLLKEFTARKMTDAAPRLFDLYAQTDDPILKGETAVALANLGAGFAAARFATDLSYINAAPEISTRRNQEALAHNLIRALEKLHDPIGFEPVFLASIGWYTQGSGIKDTAKKALVTMVDDPSKNVIDILLTNPFIEIKQVAFAAALSSNAPTASKASVAIEALRIGIRRSSSDRQSAAIATQLRLSAINALIAYADHTPDAVPLYIEAIRVENIRTPSLDETLKALEALGVNGTPDAVAYLIDRLSGYNEREKVKVNDRRDKTVIRKIVTSIAAAGDKSARDVLSAASVLGYDSDIKKLIEEAKAKLGR